MSDESTETGIQCNGFEGPCDSKNAKLQRQNTRYCDDSQNWVTMCPECAKANDEYWAERWNEFYSNCM